MPPEHNILAALQIPDCRGEPTCAPRPACPSCGGLECLCRPRFFAGQLLTDEDLNRLDHYVRTKNRLHNRYLHGWGVACGLEVVCGTCAPDQGRVVVKPGYALSPCGNDIVVCKTETVDVCALINSCRPQTDDCNDLFTHPTSHADPPQPGMVSPAPADRVPTEDWVLGICYTEKASRGVAPLRAQAAQTGCGCGGGSSGAGKTGCGCGTSSAGKSGCGCGGHGGYASASGGGGTCGCNSGGAKRKSPMVASRGLPEQCEPTVTCEGYRFVMYKVPPKRRDVRDYGAAERRFLCCIAPLLGEFPDGKVVPGPQALGWVVALRDALREFLQDEGLYDCEIGQELDRVTIPSGAGPAELELIALNLTRIAALAMQKCYCAALLPACPEPSQVDCVPLATVTVSMVRGQCRVRKICNIGARKFLVTVPNIEYWLTFVLDGSPLRKHLEDLCCLLPPRDVGLDPLKFFEQEGEQLRQQLAAEMKKPTAAWPLFQMSYADPTHELTFQRLLLASLGARSADGKALASAAEIAQPAKAVLFNKVLAPFLRSFAPTGAAAPATNAGDAGGGTRELARQLAELQATVKAQQRQLDEQAQTLANRRNKRDR